MTKYVKNEPGYEDIELDVDAIKEAYAKKKKARKNPTSINLPDEVISELKAIAQEKGIPYQTLMRMLIVEGIAKMKKTA